METWILITIAAAFLQNIRSSLQKHLKNVMDTSGATFVRFGFGMPFALLFLAFFMVMGNHTFPDLNSKFFFWIIIAAIAQIIAQALLVHMFSYRNFTVGTAYSRTEPIQAALFGFLFLSEKTSTILLLAVTISMIGVILISVARIKITLKSVATSLFSKSAIIGLSSGAIFGIAAVSYRAASLALGGPDFIIQAAITLSIAIILQSVIMFLWIYWRNKAQIIQIKSAWKTGVIVGLVGSGASFGWFMAMTLQQAALVKAVAQIEMIFTFISSVFIFKEQINKYEIIGCLLIISGIIVLVLKGKYLAFNL